MMSSLKAGGCQCGSVRYEISGRPVALYVCHCHECQKQSASAFGITYTIGRDDLHLKCGTVKVWSRAADSGRTVRCLFCPDCGSRLWHEYSGDSTLIGIKGGSLDDPIDLQTATHIWTSRKLPGVVIPEGAAQFPKEPR
jgi:hypothetical protein